MLKASPSRLGRRLGLSFVACAALGVGGAVWLMRPVEVLAAPAKELAEAKRLREEAQGGKEAGPC